MEALEEFRSSVRSWLEENSPPGLRGRMGDDLSAYQGGTKTPPPYPESAAWLEMMAQKGWTVPTWPREYGGGGLNKQEAKILIEEMTRLQLPPPVTGFGITMIGPTMLQYGTEEQKRRHIPPIVRGEIRWCQGYSEPNAGSDLASIQTKAVVDGDDYILNGQKIWTSGGNMADWIFMLVRTDWAVKKQAGITFLLADLNTPGIDIRPIKLISGASIFCEVFFEDVRVPQADVLGTVNGGWDVAKALLGHERTSIATLGTRCTGRRMIVNHATLARRRIS